MRNLVRNLVGKEKGYSILEIGFVLLIIVGIATVVVGKMTGLFTKSQTELAHQELVMMVTELLTYRQINNGDYSAFGTDGGITLLRENGYMTDPFVDDDANGNEGVFFLGMTISSSNVGAAADIFYPVQDEGVCAQLLQRLLVHDEVLEEGSECDGVNLNLRVD